MARPDRTRNISAYRRRWPVGFLVLGVPLLAVVVYLDVLLSRLPEIIRQTGWDSDGVSVMVTVDALMEGDRGTVFLGNHTEVTTLLVDLLLYPIPAHHQVWEVVPVLAGAITVALLVWAAYRLAGLRAAGLTFVLAVTGSQAVVQAFTEQMYRCFTLLGTAFLAGLLVWACRDDHPPPLRYVLAVALPASVLTAINLASDPLLEASAVVPLSVCALLVVASHRKGAAARRNAWAMLAIAGVSTATAVAIVLFLPVLGYRSPPGIPAVTLSGPTHWPDHVGLLVEGVLHLAHASLIVERILLPWRVEAVLAVAIAAAAAILFPLWSRDSHPGSRTRLDRFRVYLMFWWLSGVLTGLAFVASSAPSDAKSVRYLVTLHLAVASILPLWAAHHKVRQVGVAGLATVFALTGAFVLYRAVDGQRFLVFPYAIQQDQLLASLAAHDLHHGYAPYFDANVLTWKSSGTVRVRAVTNMGKACGLCPLYVNTMSTWYSGNQPGASFLVIDPVIGDVQTVPSDLGPPSDVYRSGRFVILVYPYDVASRFGGQQTP